MNEDRFAKCMKIQMMMVVKMNLIVNEKHHLATISRYPTPFQIHRSKTTPGIQKYNYSYKDEPVVGITKYEKQCPKAGNSI